MSDFQFYAAIANMVFFLLFAGFAWRKMAQAKVGAKAEAATAPDGFGVGPHWLWTFVFWLSLLVVAGWAYTLYLGA